MPSGECYRTYRPRTWKTMNRHARRSFYRENAARVSRGQKELPKP